MPKKKGSPTELQPTNQAPPVDVHEIINEDFMMMTSEDRKELDHIIDGLIQEVSQAMTRVPWQINENYKEGEVAQDA